MKMLEMWTKILIILLFIKNFTSILSQTNDGSDKNIENDADICVFGIKESEIEGIFVQLFFTEIPKEQWTQLQWKLSAHLFCRNIRRYRNELEQQKALPDKKIEEKLDRDEILQTGLHILFRTFISDCQKMEMRFKENKGLVDWETLKQLAEIHNKAVYYMRDGKMLDFKDEMDSDTKSEMSLLHANEIASVLSKAVCLPAEQQHKIKPGTSTAGFNKNIQSELETHLCKWHMDDYERDEAIALVKERMRKLMGAAMFNHAEIKQPVLLRIDIIERSERIRLYKNLFSNDTKSEKFLESNRQLQISQLFAKFFHLQRQEYGAEFHTRIKPSWDGRIQELTKLSPLEQMHVKLMHFWLKYKNRRERPEHKLSLAEIESEKVLLRKDNEQYLLELVDVLKEFMDRNLGARARMIYYLMLKNRNVHEILMKRENLSVYLVQDPNDEHFFDWLEQSYTQYFKPLLISERNKAYFQVKILSHIYLTNKLFADENAFAGPKSLKEEWAIYRSIFLFFFDQLNATILGEDILQFFSGIYLKMLIKIRKKLESNDKRRWTIEELLWKEHQIFKDGKTEEAQQLFTDQQEFDHREQSYRDNYRLIKQLIRMRPLFKEKLKALPRDGKEEMKFALEKWRYDEIQLELDYGQIDSLEGQYSKLLIDDGVPDETRTLFRRRIETVLIEKRIPQIYEKIKKAVETFKQAQKSKRSSKSAKKNKNVENPLFGLKAEEVQKVEEYLMQCETIINKIKVEEQLDTKDFEEFRKIYWNFKELIKMDESTRELLFKEHENEKGLNNRINALMNLVHVEEIQALMENSEFQQKFRRIFLNIDEAGIGAIKRIKGKMRDLLGPNMFTMETQKPVFYRADILEESMKFTLFEKVLSYPIKSKETVAQMDQLNFWFAFKNVFPIKLANLVNNENLHGKEIVVIEETWKVIYNWEENNIQDISMAVNLMTSWWYTLINAHAQSDEFYLDLNRGEYLKALLEMVDEPEIGRFMRFLNAIKGAKARLAQLLGGRNIVQILREHPKLKPLFEIANENDEKELLKFLAFYYIKYFNAKSAVHEAATELAIDVLVQIHFLDKFFEKHQNDQAKANSSWKELRIKYLLNVDLLLDFEDLKQVEKLGYLYRNFLYELRGLENENGESEWDLHAIDQAQLEDTLLIDPEKQTAQICTEHAKIFPILQNENAKFKNQINGLNTEATIRMQVFTARIKVNRKKQIQAYKFGEDELEFDELYVELFFEDGKSHKERISLQQKLSALLIARNIEMGKKKEKFQKKQLAEYENILENLLEFHEIDAQSFDRLRVLFVELLISNENLTVTEIIKRQDTTVILDLHIDRIKRLIQESDFIYKEENKSEQKLSKLSHKWEEVRRAGDARLKKVKGRMRHLLCEKMFNELEKPHPVLFRLDIIEDDELFALYQTILSHPLARKDDFTQKPVPEGPNQELRLGISQSFTNIWNLLRKNLAEEQAAQTIKERWEAYSTYTDYQIFLDLLTYNQTLDPENFEGVDIERTMLIPNNIACILGLVENEEINAKLKEFLQSNKLARARLITLLGSALVTNELLKEKEKLKELIGPLERDLPKFLMETYTKLFTTNLSEEEERKEEITANLLVQVHAIDLFMAKHENDQKRCFVQWFDNYRLQVFLNIDQIGIKETLTSFENINYNILYKLREFGTNAENSTWDLYALVGSELKKRDKEGVDYELYDAVGQQNQLQEEHQKMVKIFEKDANFKKMIDSLTEKGKKKLHKFIGTPAVAEPSVKKGSRKKGKKEDLAFEQCIFTKSDGFEGPDPDQVQLYKEFLNRVMSVLSIDRKREELNLDAALWHYERGIEQFLRENEKKLNSHEILENLRKELEVLRSMNTKLGKIDVKEKKLCKLQEFVEKRLKKHKELVKNDVWIEKLVKSKFIKELAQFDSISSQQCEEKEFRLKLLVILEPKLPLLHFHYLDWLITNFEEMRIYFCKRADIQWKERLIALFEEHPNVPGEKRVLQLETMHPEVLKIGNVQEDIGGFLYKQFVDNKAYSALAEEAEARLAAAYLLRWINEINNRIDKTGKIFKVKLFNAGQAKTKWLKAQLYKKPAEFASKRNICLMLRYIKFEPISRMPLEKYDKVALEKRVEEIANWNEPNCEKRQEQIASFLEAREFLQDEHRKFFVDHPQMLRLITEEKPGLKIRIDQLIPGYSKGIFAFVKDLIPDNADDIEYMQKLPRIGKELHHFLGQEYQNVFFHGRFRECLLLALTGENPKVQLAGRLCANIISFTRWMHEMVTVKMPLAASQENEILAKTLVEVWDDTIFYLGHEYENIFFVLNQYDLSKLEKLEREQAELLQKLKIFSFKKLAELKKKAARDWENKFYQNLKDYFLAAEENWKTNWVDDGGDGKDFSEIKNWLKQTLNYNEFLKQFELVSNDDKMVEKEELDGRRRFVEDLRKNFKEKTLLPPIIGENKEKLGKITKKLKLKFKWNEYNKKEVKTSEGSTSDKKESNKNTTDSEKRRNIKTKTTAENKEGNQKESETSDGSGQEEKMAQLHIDHPEFDDGGEWMPAVKSSPKKSPNKPEASTAKQSQIEVSSPTSERFDANLAGAQWPKPTKQISIRKQKADSHQWGKFVRKKKLNEKPIVSPEKQFGMVAQEIPASPDFESHKNSKQELEDLIALQKSFSEALKGQESSSATANAQFPNISELPLNKPIIVDTPAIDSSEISMQQEHEVHDRQKSPVIFPKSLQPEIELLNLQFGNFGKEEEKVIKVDDKKESPEDAEKIVHVEDEHQKSLGKNVEESKGKQIIEDETTPDNEQQLANVKEPEIDKPGVQSEPEQSNLSEPGSPSSSSSVSKIPQVDYNRTEAPDLDSNEIYRLKKVLIEHKYGVYSGLYRKEKISAVYAINQIRGVVSSWAQQFIKTPVQFIVTGSHLLQVQTVDSDIDMILLFPCEHGVQWDVLLYEYILGTTEHHLMPMGGSLYHTLFRFTMDIRNGCDRIRIILGRVAIFKFSCFGYSFDLNLVTIPEEVLNTNMSYTKPLPSLDQVDEIIANFVGIVGPSKFAGHDVDIQMGMVFALSGYRSNLQILHHLNEHNKMQTFRTIMLALKLWANKQFIYGGQFGFFNGATLSVLIARLILLNPNHTIIEYLDDFFYSYYNCRKIQFNDGTLTGHAIEKDWKQLLIGPDYKIQKYPVEIRESIDFWLKHKYDHYMAIVCTHSPQSWLGPSYCDFVESRIRVQLLNAFDRNEQLRIEWTHPKTGRVLDKQPCPQQYLHPQIMHYPFLNICTVWWVGIRTRDRVRTSDLNSFLYGPMQNVVQNINVSYQAHRDDENTSKIYPKNMWMDFDLFARLFSRNFLFETTKGI